MGFLLFLLVIAGIFIWDALRGYGAENYASKKIYGKGVDFLDYMFSNHPWIVTGVIFFIILCVIAAFTSG